MLFQNCEKLIFCRIDLHVKLRCSPNRPISPPSCPKLCHKASQACWPRSHCHLDSNFNLKFSRDCRIPALTAGTARQLVGFGKVFWNDILINWMKNYHPSFKEEKNKKRILNWNFLSKQLLVINYELRLMAAPRSACRCSTESGKWERSLNFNKEKSAR